MLVGQFAGQGRDADLRTAAAAAAEAGGWAAGFAPSAVPPPSVEGVASPPAGAAALPPPPASAFLIASSALSPFSARIRITSPTGTVAPSSMLIFATVASSNTCTSMVALSVSTSAIASPEDTLSPSLTFHLSSVPSSMVSDRRGMVMVMGMGEGAFGAGGERGHACGSQMVAPPLRPNPALESGCSRGDGVPALQGRER